MKINLAKKDHQKIKNILKECDDILASSQKGIDGYDITNSSSWIKTILETFWSGEEIKTIRLGKDGAAEGVFIYAVKTIFRFFIPIRRLETVNTFYTGRSGLLVKEDKAIYCERLLDTVLEHVKEWDTLEITILNNSACHKSIYKKNKKNFYALNTNTTSSPYIELNNSWNTIFNALPKKLRWTIRKCSNELSESDTLNYKEYTDSDSILGIIFEIEQQSWKESMLSSITTQPQQKLFYERLVINTAASGNLSAHVLFIGNKPIAYILGLISSDGAFLDLKESFVQAYSKYSPSHVLKSFVIPSLIRKNIKIYDFMGLCEPYKMQWTEKKYKRHTIVIYNKTFRGIFSYIKSLISASGKDIPAPEK